MEAIDEKNNSITIIKGDILQEYKSLKAIVQATPKDEGSLVHWIMEYEKLNKSFPKPNSLLQFVLDLNKDLNAHTVERENSRHISSEHNILSSPQNTTSYKAPCTATRFCCHYSETNKNLPSVIELGA